MHMTHTKELSFQKIILLWIWAAMEQWLQTMIYSVSSPHGGEYHRQYWSVTCNIHLEYFSGALYLWYK